MLPSPNKTSPQQLISPWQIFLIPSHCRRLVYGGMAVVFFGQGSIRQAQNTGPSKVETEPWGEYYIGLYRVIKGYIGL